ncbi:MAG TPA: hypothetical protein VGN83_20055 [Falsiroseomonas sp.]|jgi:hypothetical protein|nr:hypothetical protein [Falsiroseomonas sp.]
MVKRGKGGKKMEPAGRPDAAADMSAQLRPEGAAAPLRTAPAQPARRSSEPGDVAFDRWLKRELGRLYDETLAEPVPEELARLLDPTAPTGREPGKNPKKQ